MKRLTLLLFLFSAACASTANERVRGELLPFHAAIVPLTDIRIVEPSETPAVGSEETATDMRIEIDPAAMSHAVANELAIRVFPRVTLLDGTTEEALDRQAREAGADIVLQLALQYDPRVWHEHTGSSGLNFLYFTVGGPMGLEQRDYTYYAAAELDAEAFSIAALGDPDLRLGDPRARVLVTEASFPGAALSYNERARGEESFTKTLFIPTENLATMSPELAEYLGERVTQDLAAELADTLLLNRTELLLERGAKTFFIDEGDLEVSRPAVDLVVVEGVVTLPASSTLERMHSYHLDAGPSSVGGDFTKGNRRGDDTLFPFRVEIDPDGAEFLQLELVGGARDPIRQTYTLAVPPVR